MDWLESNDIRQAGPALGAILFVFLCLWPLARLFKRSGRSGWWALLFLPGMVLPFAGYILAGLAFLIVKRSQGHDGVADV